MADMINMRSPHTGEIRQVEATPETLAPLMSQGWTQVPAPAEKPVTPTEEER